jgi:hypothetical protein
MDKRKHDAGQNAKPEDMNLGEEQFPAPIQVQF